MRISVLIVVWCVTWISFECFSYSLSLSFSLSLSLVSFLISFFLSFYMSHLLLFRILSLSTYITFGFIELFFLGFSSLMETSEVFFTVQTSTCITFDLIGLIFFFGFSSWTETSRVLLTIQACHSALNTVMLGRWPSLMRRLLCNHQEISKSYLGEVYLLWDLPR